MIVLLLLFIAVTVSAKNITSYNLKNAPQHFDDFVKVYDRKYYSDEDKEMRYQIFLQNLEKINIFNRRSKHASFGINQFADLTVEEFLTQYTGYKRSAGGACTNVYQRQKLDEYIEIPEEFDWRSRNVVTRVKNQGTCGSCWAFSVTGNVESINAIKTGELRELSEQQLVDCDTAESGCSGGYPSQALQYLKNNGAISAENYPYDGNNGQCRYNSGNIAVSVADCISVSVSEDNLPQQLYKIGPLSIAVDATNLQGYTNGVIAGNDCNHSARNHAVLLVGYGVDAGVSYWLVKNSWGETWGEQGYFKLQRGVNCLGVVDETPVSAIV